MQTLIVTLLSILSTYLSLRYELIGEFPLTIIGIAVIFPIVFSIGGAYKRREDALREYGSLKGHGRALYFSSRDWLEKKNTKLELKMKKLLEELMNNFRELFHEPIDKMDESEKRVYKKFSEISEFVNELRKAGLPSGEASRCNQFISKMIVSFENIKHIYQYRTPKTLRTYSKLFIYLIPIIYGPYFAFLSTEFSHYLTYVMPIVFSVVFVCLDNIQDHLENPFDQVGEDDVVLNADKFVKNLEIAWIHPEYIYGHFINDYFFLYINWI